MNTMYNLIRRVTLLSTLVICGHVHAGYQVTVFYNKWCSHCKSWMKSTGENYEHEAPDILGDTYPHLLKLDLAQQENLAQYKELMSSGRLSQTITAVPTFVIFDHEQIEVARHVGAMSKDDFYAFVKKTVGQS